MEKPAETTHAIHDLLRRRWSPRAFANQAVEPETLGSLVEAARWAPSCFNEQPWSFLVATKDNDSEHRRMLECVVEGNVGWAQHAPVLMISVAKLAFDRNGKPNTHAWHDVGLAVGNMLVQATALGLGAHQMAGFYPEKAKEVYGIPDGHEPVAAIALGYPGNSQSLPDELQRRERGVRSRKAMNEFVFMGHWNQAASFIA